MESAVARPAQALKSDLSAQYAAKMAKFEEFRKRREQEKQDRLARIEARKQELRDRKITEIRKTSSVLQVRQNTDNLKEHPAGKAKIPTQQNASESVKSRLTSVRGRPASTIKERPIARAGPRRMTIATQGLPSTLKKPLKESLPSSRKVLVQNENVGTALRSSVGAKRRLLGSNSELTKKPCLQVRESNVKSSNVQQRNSRTPSLKGGCVKDTLLRKPMKEDVHSGIQPLQGTEKESAKKLTRLEELEVWKQKKQMPTGSLTKKPAIQSRRESLPAGKVGLKLLSSAAKTSVKKPAATASCVKTDPRKTKTEKSTTAKTQAVGSRTSYVPSAQKISTENRLKASSGLVRAKQAGAAKAAHKMDLPSKTNVLETIVSEPSTPQLKGPRMSTPLSNRHVKSPASALALSSILGSKVRRYTASWTPKTPKSPRAALSMKLVAWLEARGKTPSRYRHLACHGVHARDVSTPLPSSKHCVQKINSTFKVDGQCGCNVGKDDMNCVVEMFTEAISLVQQGFLVDKLSTWLHAAAEKIPDVSSLAHYWSLKACIAAAGNHDGGEALKILEEGERSNAKPLEELEKARSYINQNFVKHNQVSDAVRSECTRLITEVQQENVFESSTVKFSMRRVPNFHTAIVTPQKVVVTPVRRSTRKSCGHLPAGLRDHDTIVESIDEIPTETRPVTLFRSNVALNLQWSFEESTTENE